MKRFYLVVFFSFLVAFVFSSTSFGDDDYKNSLDCFISKLDNKCKNALKLTRDDYVEENQPDGTNLDRSESGYQWLECQDKLLDIVFKNVLISHNEFLDFSKDLPSLYKEGKIFIKNIDKSYKEWKSFRNNFCENTAAIDFLGGSGVWASIQSCKELVSWQYTYTLITTSMNLECK